jgi:ActR/RegA family two-component response regulator
MRVLIIDDDRDYRRILRYHVEVEWPEALVEEHQPSSAGGSPESIDFGSADVVLLGHPLARERGFVWLAALRVRADCPPVIVFAAPSNEFLAVEAMKTGAASYFPKSEITHRRFVEQLREEVAAARSPAGPPADAGSGRPERWAGRELDLRGGSRRHRFVRKLHATDLSTVYLAESPDGGDRVVYKVLQQVPDANSQRLFDRFLQEYEVISRVRHANVVRIFDLGVADDHAYIVMEYFEGGSLAQRIASGTTFEEAVAHLRQIASALAAIHEAGVLHRDLKPANVMFRQDGTLALIDFGLAKQLQLEAAFTGAGQIFGTPYYMSPEQGHAEPADERSDLYSLGCIAYELLTGNKPFMAPSALGVIYKHAHAARPRLPAPLEPFQPCLDRLLAPAPADRYQSAAELLSALERF